MARFVVQNYIYPYIFYMGSLFLQQPYYSSTTGIQFTNLAHIYHKMMNGSQRGQKKTILLNLVRTLSSLAKNLLELNNHQEIPSISRQNIRYRQKMMDYQCINVFLYNINKFVFTTFLLLKALLYRWTSTLCT